MAVHTITLPVRHAPDDPPRNVVWDDVAGTVEGDHPQLPYFQRILAEPKPVDVGLPGWIATVRDPAHDPADMLVLIFCATSRLPADLSLPPIFDGVELAEGEPDEELYDERGELLT